MWRSKRRRSARGVKKREREGGEEGGTRRALVQIYVLTGVDPRHVMFYPHVCKLSCLFLPKLNLSLCSYVAWDWQRFVICVNLKPY